MAHVGDKCEVCQKHDLLPLRCDLCGLRCCTEHIPAAAHECKGREDNVSLAKPGAVGLGAALKREMEAVARRFEGQEWSTKEHFKVKATAAALAQSAQKENRYLRAYRARLAAGGGGGSEKTRRVGEQVRRMLIKGKATGRNNLHPDDRFYLEIRFGGLGGGADGAAARGEGEGAAAAKQEKETVDYLFVSRLWTLGRTLDEVVGKHGAALARAYPDADPQEGYGLLNDRTGRPLTALTRALMEFGPTELADTDPLLLLPAAAVVAAAAAAAVDVDSGSVDATVAPEAKLEEQEQGAVAAATTAVEEAPVAVGGGSVVTITVTQGKTAHAVAFDEEAWQSGALTVVDLKARVAALTGVRPERQKLLFKGVLGGEGPLAATQLKDGSKVVLMGSSK